jgi:hypothetical protein
MINSGPNDLIINKINNTNIYIYIYIYIINTFIDKIKDPTFSLVREFVITTTGFVDFGVAKNKHISINVHILYTHNKSIQTQIRSTHHKFIQTQISQDTKFIHNIL